MNVCVYVYTKYLYTNEYLIFVVGTYLFEGISIPII